ATGAFRSAGKKVKAELTAGAEVAVDLANPVGEPAGIGQCRPQVVDVGVEAVLHAHDAFAICRSQAAQDAGIAGHLVLLRSRFPGPPRVRTSSSPAVAGPPLKASSAVRRSGVQSLPSPSNPMSQWRP